MKKASLLFFSLLLFAGISCKDRKTWHNSTLFYFDTVCEVTLYCSSPQFYTAQEKIHQILSQIEILFSPENKDLSSPLVFNLFEKAASVFYGSDGAFDITVGPLLDLWGFRSGPYSVPNGPSLLTALESVGMEKIKTKEKQIILPPNMALDWGGIAKGYGVDVAAMVMIEMGIQKGFINAGGDLYCWGTNPDHKPWQIGIKHPREESFLGILSLSDIGAATAGDYQRFFLKDGIRYHHIFDPKTGCPAYGKQSVTAIGPEASICDALSTALFVSSDPAAILERYPTYGAIIVNKEGEISRLGKLYPFYQRK